VHHSGVLDMKSDFVLGHNVLTLASNKETTILVKHAWTWKKLWQESSGMMWWRVNLS